MSKISLILVVAFQVGLAGTALAAPGKQSTHPGITAQEQALIDRTGPAPGGEP
jgi:hypothetical protein